MSLLLAVDPGAERCGWAILREGPELIDSGILKTHRDNREEFQYYRLRLEREAYWFFDGLLNSYHDDQRIGHVVNEIVPAVGGGNFSVTTQSYLVNCVCTALHIAAFGRGCTVNQVSARTVQSRIAKKANSKGITKAQVRNGVISIIPKVGQDLTTHLLEWDRWDAIAIGLTELGLSQ